jgi:hypothetical protein
VRGSAERGLRCPAEAAAAAAAAAEGFDATDLAALLERAAHAASVRLIAAG